MSGERELVRGFDLAGLAGHEVAVEVSADQRERAALASRFALEAVETLAARLAISRGAQGTIRVRGRLTAVVLQRCVVSLEPFAARIEESFSRTFGAAEVADVNEVLIDVGAGDPVEPLVGDELDLGEIVAEQLGLSIDPYPRKAEAEFRWRDPDGGAKEAGGGDSPFAALKTLKPESGPR